MDVVEHFFTIEENKEVNELLTCLAALDSVTTERQDKTHSLLKSRNLLNELIQKYRRLDIFFHVNSFITENSTLETAIS